MFRKKTIIILCFFLFSFFISASEEKNSKKGEAAVFELKNNLFQNKENVQKVRFQNRIKRILEYVGKINEDFKIQDKEALAQDILVLGDECYSLFNVAEFPEKKVKKIKKYGNTVNNLCIKLNKKIDNKPLAKIKKQWNKVNKKINEILVLCKE